MLFIVLFRIQSSYSALQRINQDLEEKIHRDVSVKASLSVCVCVCVCVCVNSHACCQVPADDEERDARKQVMRLGRATEHSSQFEYEYTLLLVPLTLIMAYYNWLSSLQWRSDSKPIVPQCTAPHFICQTLLVPVERYN